MNDIWKQIREKQEREKKDPNFVFFMDGDAHYKEEETGCCGSFGKQCSKCKGFMHYQPVYGGYYYQCENCKKIE